MDSRHLPILIAVVGVGLIYMYWQLYRKNQLLEQQLYYLHNHIQQLTSIERNQEPIEIDLDKDEEDEHEEIIDNLPRVIEEVELNGYEEDSDEESEPEGVEQHKDNIREIEEEVTPAEDVVITKLSHCPHILQSGKNKGSSCGKPAIENGYCKNHCSLAPEPLC